MKSVEIRRHHSKLVLAYQPSHQFAFNGWIDECVTNNDKISIGRDFHSNAVFTFLKDDVLKKVPIKSTAKEEFIDTTEEYYIWHFKLGQITTDGYYKIPARILSSKHDVFIYKTVVVTMNLFSAQVFKTRIVPIIDRMIEAPLIIGGGRDCAIPEREYFAIISKLPKVEELHYYAQSRIEGVLSEYYPQTHESSLKLADYIQRRYKRAENVSEQLKNIVPYDNAITELHEIERVKMQFGLDRLRELLVSAKQYAEHK